MAIRNILQIGDETLNKKCFQVTEFDEKLWALLDDMRDTVRSADGVGLAAPQVGVLRRVFVIDLEEGYYEFVNPEITYTSGLQTGKEGCLSVRHRCGQVTRPKKVVVKAFDRFGKPFTVTAKNLFARAVCHENDHLDGILYVQRAESMEDDDL